MAIGKSGRALLDRLVASGALSKDDADALATTQPRSKGRTCIGCGARAGKLDYVCGACSILQIDEPKKFWDKVRRREAETGKPLDVLVVA